MSRIRYTLLLLVLPLLLSAQGTPPAEQDELYLLEMQSRLQLFLDAWQGLASDLQYSSLDSLKSMEQRLKQLDAKWQLYSQAQQMDIAGDETLLEIVGKIQVAKQSAQESLEKQQSAQQMLKDFRDAETFISSQDTVYRRLVETTAKMALVKQLAARLDKLKGQEQLRFTEIQNHYDAAKKAAEAIPALQDRMNKLQERYISLKTASDKIQQTVYQPWITRIKDYLLGTAAVAVILMFFSMITAKIKAAKQARQQAKKLRDMLPQGTDRQYPVI
ncbi:MAG: hypothetical protein J5545_01265 [Bacteroidaceae bacterium]|nr:hypothetical protein [Bacteroidaceae bacterium]